MKLGGFKTTALGGGSFGALTDDAHFDLFPPSLTGKYKIWVETGPAGGGNNAQALVSNSILCDSGAAQDPFPFDCPAY
jgi:hypothetical protein